MKYFLFSLLLLCLSCRSAYKDLVLRENKIDCTAALTEPFKTSWFNASVDVYGRHLSGLLLVKRMEGGDYRVVLTNEAGVTLFDLALSSTGDVEVKKMIKQMDRKPVIEVLRKDFALLLRLPFSTGEMKMYHRGDELLIAAQQKKETAYFITDKDCASLRRLEWASPRKTEVTISISGPVDAPESASIKHHNFDMVINLKKIERE